MGIMDKALGVLGGAAGFLVGGPAGAAVGASAGLALGGSLDSTTQENRARRQQQRAMDRNLAFQMQQYKDWQAVYGDIEKNVGQFYKALTPEKVAAIGLQKQNEAFTQFTKELTRSFAQRGIDSPAQDAMLQEATLANAIQRATIRQQAPWQVAEMQSNWVGQGRGSRGPAIAGVSNANMAEANYYGGQADRYAAQAGAQMQAFSSLIGTAGYMAGTGGFNPRPTAATPTPSLPAGSPGIPYNRRGVYSV